MANGDKQDLQERPVKPWLIARVKDNGERLRAIDAGAQFIVTPGMTLDVVALCRNEDVFVFPGAATATCLTPLRG